MKEGLNRMDIKRYHNMLKDGVPLKSIARALHTSVRILNLLTPERYAAAEKKKKAADKAAKQLEVENRSKASIMTQAAQDVLTTSPEDIAKRVKENEKEKEPAVKETPIQRVSVPDIGLKE